MFFLAVLVWATLSTEPPKIVHAYAHLDECLVAADKQNNSFPAAGPNAQVSPVRFICLEARGV